MFMSKVVNLVGLLGDIKEDWRSGDGSPPAWSRGGALVEGLPEAEAAPETEAFFVKLHILYFH